MAACSAPVRPRLPFGPVRPRRWRGLGPSPPGVGASRTADRSGTNLRRRLRRRWRRSPGQLPGYGRLHLSRPCVPEDLSSAWYKTSRPLRWAGRTPWRSAGPEGIASRSRRCSFVKRLLLPSSASVFIAAQLVGVGLAVLVRRCSPSRSCSRMSPRVGRNLRRERCRWWLRRAVQFLSRCSGPSGCPRPNLGGSAPNPARSWSCHSRRGCPGPQTLRGSRGTGAPPPP